HAGLWGISFLLRLNPASSEVHLLQLPSPSKSHSHCVGGEMKRLRNTTHCAGLSNKGELATLPEKWKGGGIWSANPMFAFLANDAVSLLPIRLLFP
ncbi:hypothetical protein CDAR_232671, partial [Caerostris darwini]